MHVLHYLILEVLVLKYPLVYLISEDNFKSTLFKAIKQKSVSYQIILYDFIQELLFLILYPGQVQLEAAFVFSLVAGRCRKKSRRNNRFCSGRMLDTAFAICR